MARKGPLELALNRALHAISLDREYDAIVELAREYARSMDSAPERLWRLGPRLLETLESLQMTPRSRVGVENPAPPAASPVSPIDELRQRRAQRVQPNE